MNNYDMILACTFFILLIISSIFLGRYMAKVFEGEKTFLSFFLRPIEMFIYRIVGVSESEEMSWKTYAWIFIVFNILGILSLFILQLVQGFLPFNPQNLPGVRWDTAFNTAVSYVTNTNWQSYSGEQTMSYLTQMLGLTVQNFISAGIGMAAALPVIRGFIRRESSTVGNLWVDMIRSVLYILLPLSLLVSLLLLSQGVIQNLNGYVSAHTLEGATQSLPMGPVASQVAIKQLGSNGGGFFNANSAHPFENPTFLSNMIENFCILLIPMAFVFMFGYMIKKPKQGRALFLIMLTLFVVGLSIILYTEFQDNPSLLNAGIAGPGLNLEGKETRFGIFWSSVWGQSTTVTSNGSVNSMHDSFMPLSGMVMLFNMGIGEVIFGGVGVGIIGIIFYVILSMFVAGLMIGRTPEFLGKKFGPDEMILSMIGLIIPMVALVIFSSIAISTKAGLSSINNPSAHGLTEILYAYSSAHGNNGSAFAGLNADTVFFNCTIAIGILIGRFATIIPAIALGGLLAKKKIVPESAATFPTTGFMFIIVVIVVILIMGALTFFPVYSLGPIVEHLFTQGMKLFVPAQ